MLSTKRMPDLVSETCFSKHWKRRTAIIAECCKLYSLLSVAGTVRHFHLQLIPGGLLQVIENVTLCKGRALCCGPSGKVDGPVFQCEGGDWTPAIIPAIQVELDPGGVDAGEKLLFFRVLRFCFKNNKKILVVKSSKIRSSISNI